MNVGELKERTDAVEKTALAQWRATIRFINEERLKMFRRIMGHARKFEARMK